MNQKLIDKRNYVLNNMAIHNDEFLRQARIKINRYIYRDPSDPDELVSDVLFSIIKKLNCSKEINRFHQMAQDDMLFNYITKAIDRNARYLNTPFGRKKLTLLNRTSINEILYLPEEAPEELHEDVIAKAEYIKSLFEPKNAKEIFGDRWKLFKTLIEEYVENPKCTYAELSKKYGIPLGSVSWTFTLMKTKIRERAQKDGKI